MIIHSYDMYLKMVMDIIPGHGADDNGNNSKFEEIKIIFFCFCFCFRLTGYEVKFIYLFLSHRN